VPAVRAQVEVGKETCSDTTVRPGRIDADGAQAFPGRGDRAETDHARRVLGDHHPLPPELVLVLMRDRLSSRAAVPVDQAQPAITFNAEKAEAIWPTAAAWMRPIGSRSADSAQRA